MVPEPTQDASALVDLLARRGRYLESVADSPVEKRTLVDRHETSRSTVDRAVRELADAGLVDRTHGHVALTLPGRLALDAYEEFYARLDGLTEATGVLDAVAADAPLDVCLFEDATVVDAAHTPQRPFDAVADVLTNATAVRTIATVVFPEHVKLYRDRIVENGLRASVVVTPDVLDVLVADYADTVNDVVHSDQVELHLSDDGLPYGLVVASLDDRDVALVVCGQGTVDGVVRNDDPDAVAWANGRFEEVRDAATRIG